MAVPVDPLGGGQLDLGQCSPRPAGLDQLGLEESDRGLHQGIVVGVADRSDRRGDAGPVEVFGERERRVLRPGIAVMYQLAFLVRVLVAVALPQSHLQGVQDEACLLRGGCRPADDAAGEGVHDEGHADDAGEGGDVGEIGDPAAVRGRGDEVTVHQVRGPLGTRIGDRGDHLLAADRSGDTEVTHEAFDGAAGHHNVLPVQVPPDLPGAVDAVVGLVRLSDQGLQLGVADGAGRGCGLAFVVGVVGGRCDLAVVVGQDPADRLDAAEAVLVLVDERYERVCGRSSSAAKKDAAAFRISLARFSSAFSFFSAFIAADSSVVVPGR